MPSDQDFDFLVEAYSAEIFSYLWRMARDTQDAEDWMQDAFLRAYRAFPRLDAEANHRAWLYKIATNVARTQLARGRRAASHTMGIDPEKLQGDVSPLEEVDRRDRLRLVADAVDALPYKQRAALILRKYQSMEYSEIAVLLDISEEAARANVYQALKKLRAQFMLLSARSGNSR